MQGHFFGKSLEVVPFFTGSLVYQKNNSVSKNLFTNLYNKNFQNHDFHSN
jgi:hypothetical protein